MKTYIVIPQYIVNDELAELSSNMIKSVRKTEPDIVVVSVDDASTQDTKFLKDLSDVYLRNKANSGFAKTCNVGFRWVFENTKEDCYIICANNDIEVFGDWFKHLKEPFDLFDNVSITGLISSKYRIFGDGTRIEDFNIQKITDGGRLEDWMQSGGLWMSKKSILQEIGIFDECFEVGGFEDVDLFLRARDTYGKRIIMSGKSCFWHKEGATRWEDKVKAKNKAIEVHNHQRFIDKWKYDPNTRDVWKENIIWQP
jgi:GT2 family glycosyltransferase